VKKSSRVGFLRSTSFPFFLLFCCNIYFKTKRKRPWRGLAGPFKAFSCLKERKDRTFTRTERQKNTYSSRKTREHLHEQKDTNTYMNRKTDERLVEMDRFFSYFTFSYFSSFLPCSLPYFDYFPRFSDLTFSVLWSFFFCLLSKNKKKTCLLLSDTLFSFFLFYCFVSCFCV
jgi:hypothetical protein